MAKQFVSILAAAFLCNPEVAGMSLSMKDEEGKHGTSLHRTSDEEENQDSAVSLMSRNVVLLKMKTTTTIKTTTTEPLQEKIEQEKRKREEEKLLHLIFVATVFWVTGLCLGLIGQSAVAVGYLIQKMAQMAQMPSRSTSGGRSPRMSPRDSQKVLDKIGVGHAMSGIWWAGIAVFCVGHLFCWMALGFAPQAVLACLQSWNMVVVMLLGPRMLKEAVPRGTCQYCCLIILGCIIVVACGPQENPHPVPISLSWVLDRMYHWYWLSPAGIAILLMVVVSSATDISPTYAFIVLSAACAWYASTLAKITAVLAIMVVVYGEAFNYGFFLILAAFALLAIAQIHFMNMALKHGDATLVIPLYECLSMIGQIVFGAIFWREFYGIGVFRFSAFVFGVAVIVVGLALLTHAKVTTEKENTPRGIDADDALQDA